MFRLASKISHSCVEYSKILEVSKSLLLALNVLDKGSTVTAQESLYGTIRERCGSGPEALIPQMKIGL